MDEGRFDGWSSSVAREVDAVHRRSPRMPDDRASYPGLVGYLGDPASKVWFIGSYPSRGAIQDAARLGTVSDAEQQWTVTSGDRIFREALVEFGFKSGAAMGPGGWDCYITNLIKRPIKVARWKAALGHQSGEFARWEPVLCWEIENGGPELIVAMGEEVSRQLDVVKCAARTRRATVMHYATLITVTVRPIVWLITGSVFGLSRECVTRCELGRVQQKS